MARVLDLLIEVGVIALFLFSPLPFGSVDSWARSVIEGGVALLVTLWLARMLVVGELVLSRSPLLWPGLVMGGLIALQLRLPVGGSVNSHATWESFRLYLAYFGLLLVLGAHLVTRARVLRLLSILVGWGALLAILGFANQTTGRALAPWFPSEFAITRLTSTFVNPNHQALYFAVLFFLGVGLLLRPERPSGIPLDERAEAEGGRADRRAVGALARPVLLLAATATIGGALVFTLSRGGLLGLGVGLCVVLALSLHGRTAGWTLLGLGGVFALMLVATSWFDVDAVLARLSASFSKEPFADARWAVYGQTLRLLGDYPLLGTGLGTYQDVFPLYRPPGITTGKAVDHAHNDYLQLGAEAGYAGLLVLAWALTGLVVFVMRRWRLRHDPFVRGVTVGGLAALGAVAGHSVLDFGLHMPANALLATLLGALLPVVVALRTRRGSGGSIDLPTLRTTLTRGGRVTGSLAVAAWIVLAGFLVVPPAAADWHLQKAAALAGEARRAEGGVTTQDLARAYGELRAAARWDPGSPAIQAALADVAEDLAQRAWAAGVGPGGRRLGASVDARLAGSQEYLASALVAYETVLRRNPKSARPHDRFGRFLVTVESVRQAIRGTSMLRTRVDPRLSELLDSDQSLLPRALTHFREGVRWAPQDPYRHRNLGYFALTHLRGAQRDQVASEAFRAALTMEPLFLSEIVDRLELAGAPWSLVAASLPRRADVWLALARHLDARGRSDAASTAFQEALALAMQPDEQARARVAYGHSLLRRGQPRVALDQIRQALVAVPKSHEVFAALGEVYESLRQWEDAGAALESALHLARDAEAWQVRAYRSRLASVYERGGRWQDAMTVRRRILQDQPGDGESRVHVAKILEQQGSWAEAFPEYRLAAQAAPAVAWIQTEVGLAYARNDLLREAVTTLEGAVRLAPSQAGPRVELARLYARLGDRDRAAEQYRYVLAGNPDNQEARTALASSGVQASPPASR